MARDQSDENTDENEAPEAETGSEATTARSRTDTEDGIEVVDKSKRAMPRELDLKVDLDKLEIGQTTLEVENLEANLDISVSVANFVHVSARARAHIDKLSLEVDGVIAEAHLGLDIQHVTKIIEASVEKLVEHPELVEALGRTVDATTENLAEGLGLADADVDQISDSLATRILARVKSVTPGSDGDDDEDDS